MWLFLVGIASDQEEGELRSPVIGASCWVRLSLNKKKDGVRSRVCVILGSHEEEQEAGGISPDQFTTLKFLTLRPLHDNLITIRFLRNIK